MTSYFLQTDSAGNIKLHDVAERDRWIEGMDAQHEADAIRKGTENARQLLNVLDRRINDLNGKTHAIDARLNDRTKPVCINNTCINENQLKKIVGLVEGKQHFELATYYGNNNTNVHCAYGAGPNMAVNNKNVGCQGDVKAQSHHRWHLRLL